MAGWLFGVLGAHGLRRDAAAIDAALGAIDRDDHDALDRLLVAGLDRYAGAPHNEPRPTPLAFLAGGRLRVYEYLRSRGIRPTGRGVYVCEGADGKPGCGVAFHAYREASWCPRCQHRPIAFSPWGACTFRWAERFEPDCRTVIYGRVCEVCGAGFETRNVQRVYCSSACRQRAYRQRAA